MIIPRLAHLVLLLVNLLLMLLLKHKLRAIFLRKYGNNSLGVLTDATPSSSRCLQVNNNILDLPVSIESIGCILNLEQPTGNIPIFTPESGVTVVPAGICE
jgi:hypothetical protein